MRCFILISVGVASMVLAGCKPANKLVGTWKLSGPLDAKMQFNNNGSFDMTLNTEKGNIDEGGTYTTDGKSLTMTVTKYDVSSSDPAIQKQLDANKSMLDQALKNPKPTTLKLDWKSDNQFSMGGVSMGMGGANQTGTFTRQ